MGLDPHQYWLALLRRQNLGKNVWPPPDQILDPLLHTIYIWDCFSFQQVHHETTASSTSSKELQDNMKNKMEINSVSALKIIINFNFMLIENFLNAK